MPPTLVFSAKLTEAPARGPLDWSSTRKTIVDVSGWSVLPVPLSAMFVTVADSNTIEPTAAAAIVTEPVAVTVPPLTAADAVITSVPVQPFAMYVVSSNTGRRGDRES